MPSFAEAPALWILIIYLLIINVYAVFLTMYDKGIATKNGKSSKKVMRVPERNLFIVSAMGGSIAMYATMQIIRHKTQHKSFMIGIPAIIVAQIILVVALIIIF